MTQDHKNEISDHEDQNDPGGAHSRADSLLECLSFLSAHYGRAKSAEAITADLPYDERGMGPVLFCEAAERLGLRSKVVKRKNLKDIPSSVLPVVIILKDESAIILMSVKGKTAIAYLPEIKAQSELKLADLEKDFNGFAIFTHPATEFLDPEAKDKDDTSRHWFWGQVQRNKGIYGMALLGAVFINLFALASPLFIMNVYDRVIPNNAIATGWALGIGALTVFVFDLLMRTLRAYLIDLASRRMDVTSGRRLYDHVLNMKLASRPKSSGAFANMLRDFDSVREFFTSATITGLVDLPFTLFFLFIIYQLGGLIAIVLTGLILVVMFLGYLIQFKLKAFVRKSVQSSEAKHGLLVETIHGLETLKAIRADGRFRARYTSYMADNAHYGQGARFWSGLGVNIATFLQQTASVIVVLIGMYLVQDQLLSMGGLIAIVILGGRAIAPIGQIANLMSKYHQAGSSLKTLNTIMQQPVERPEDKQFLHRPDLKGGIAFENISFSYPRAKHRVLHNVSFQIMPGEKVAMIGRIGSGKSTIARLIMGLYEPEDGKILIDETDYQQIDPADLRRNMAYIAQDVTLFSGTVRDNIAISVPGAKEEDILHASKLSGVHDFISRHPMGYDAPVGEGGEGFSGGQRQAIALARAMLTNPKVMVCDEPTNAMDIQAEQAFKKYIEEQVKDKTFILITHKHLMLDMVDRIILMDQGRVVMDGSREEVVEALKSGKIEVKK